MRTKSLCLAAATLAAGVLASSAQSNVYSLNIVGYVNTVLKGGGAFTLVANPLDDGNGNQLTNLVAALPNKSTVQVWNGTGYTPASKALGNWSTNFSIPPGTGFFVKNANATDITNTFVGNVVASPATNSFSAGVYALVGSPLPIGGSLNDTNFNLGQTLPNKSTIQIWDNSGAGAFVPSSKALNAWSANLTINVGQGAFVKSASTTNWVQVLPPAP